MESKDPVRREKQGCAQVRISVSRRWTGLVADVVVASSISATEVLLAHANMVAFPAPRKSQMGGEVMGDHLHVHP